MPDSENADRALASLLAIAEPDATARLIETGDDAESAAFLETLGAAVMLPVIGRLTPDRASRIVASLSETGRREVLSALSQNRAAAMLARLNPDELERCLEVLDHDLAEELRALLEYPPETAGSLMDPRATSFRPDASTQDVVKRLKTFRSRRDQDVFVVNADGVLQGSVPLESIVLAEDGVRLDSLVRGTPVSVPVVASRDEIVQTFEAQRVGSLPVVDIDGRLMGVLRQQELVQAAQERALASAITMVGASDQERALSSPLFAIRKRLPWLQVNLLTAFLAATVVGLFEETIATVTALAVLLPVVAGQSGNTGAQALAVTMRGLALREVRTRHWLKVSAKEMLAGAGNGVAVALTTSVAVYFWSQSWGLGLVIGLSMVLSMTLAGLSGAVIPMVLTALRQDPAQSSSIILTTVTDVVGFFSFLGIATLLMSKI